MADSATLCEELPWDSSFFGLSIARALPAHLDAPACDAMLEWCRTHGVDCLYFLAPPDDTTTIRLLHDGGFQLVGARVTLARHAPAGIGDVHGHVRRAVEGDIPELRDIASSAHRDTRFHADNRFDAARCDELYATWIENSVRGYADHVLVAERDGALAGYLTLHVATPTTARGAAARTARIALFAVHERYRNQGVGRDLLRSAARMLAEEDVTETSVVTAGRNIAALSLYKSEGFKTMDVALWYHRWFRDRRR
jgi:dTDP-4-amino-4,6-dideoxy-D-galactose acyltransferase